MLCDYHTVVEGQYMRYNKLERSENFLGKVRKLFLTEWFENQTASWNTYYQPDFTEVLTKRGFGYSFNMLPALQLFTKKY